MLCGSGVGVVTGVPGLWTKVGTCGPPYYWMTFTDRVSWVRKAIVNVLSFVRPFQFYLEFLFLIAGRCNVMLVIDRALHTTRVS